ncbi:MAG: sulfurtransferase TusA family protein [Peptococcaceae bacterium]|nr:sulfurtransferase TusA family protein [Peptococcaceae bacterium]
MAEIVINAKGLQCPGPIVQVFKEIQKCASRDILCIEATDHAFKKDIISWCKKTRNELLSIEEKDGFIRARIMKS